MTVLLGLLMVISCDTDNSDLPIEDENEDDEIEIVLEPRVYGELTKRPGPVPETTTKVPHVQIGVEPVPEVNQELFRRVYSIPGIENKKSVIASWRGLRLNNQVNVVVPEATIDGREFAHIHDDGSLHIFLEPSRARVAVDSCWATFHPFAARGLEEWKGFVMLYTPQSFDELDVIFQLIVDGYNYVTAQNLVSTDFH